MSEVEVQANYLLSQEGFLKFTNEPPRSLADIDASTKAFALDPARIYIHLEGKYPRGSVKAEDRDAIIGELKNIFESLEVDGRKAVRRICLKEEIYQGPCFDHAPDMVLLSNEGIDLKASLKANQLAGKDVFTGKHSQKDAFLLINKPVKDIIPESLSVSDVLGVMNRLKEAA
jgi:predicted AlkP superfamily phosphohydrolase/phosphomutase